MSLLVFVRHGQASFFSDDYDQLSHLGLAQAEALGHYWASKDLRWDKVYTGPLQRHRQTESAVASVFRHYRRTWPDASELPELDEIPAIAVLNSVLKRHSTSLGADFRHLAGKDEGNPAMRQFFRVFEDVIRRWALGDLPVPEHENWQEAKHRARTALDKLTSDTGSDQRILAFSSAGLLSMVVGELLNLSNEKILDLMTVFKNSAFVEVQFKKNRRFLLSFNNVPHLGEAVADSLI